MCIFLLAILLQATPPQKREIPIPKAPSTITMPPSKQTPVQSLQFGQSRINTTPDLDPDTQLTHLQMEGAISGQGVEIINLQNEVANLEKLRADPDRKDIDSLIGSRNHIEWTWGILSTVTITILGTLFALYRKFGNIIWVENIKPRIRRQLTDIWQQTQHTTSSST